MMSMMGSPPQGALLRSSLRHEGNYKLKPTRGLIRLMGEISVISPSHPEHPGKIQEDANGPIEPGGAGKQCS
jgi:hypothetical protein